MAKSKSLPAYKEAQRLVSTLHETTKKAPKELRHTLVQRLLSESVELVVDIDTANRLQGHARSNHIDKAQRRNARLDVLLFVAMEQRCLSKGAAAKAMEHIDGLGRQLHGWSAQTSQMSGSLAPKAETSTR